MGIRASILSLSKDAVSLKRMHLWIQNQLHTWKRVVDGLAIPPISGEILIPDVPPGNYSVEWRNPYELTDPIFLTQELSSNGSLTLALPAALSTDVVVKIEKLP